MKKFFKLIISLTLFGALCMCAAVAAGCFGNSDTRGVNYTDSIITEPNAMTTLISPITYILNII